MPLVGTLSTMPLTDLLQWLGSTGRAGTLILERDKISRKISFHEGRIIACATDDPKELLGHFLVSRGKISESTLRQALARQELAGGHLGAILVSMGALSAEELTRQLTAKAEETIFGLFDLQGAVFRFLDDDTSTENAPFPVDLRVEDILLRGMQRLDEMRQIRTVFNDPGIVLRRTPRPPPQELFANRMAREIFESITGERTVADILLHAHASEYLVTKFLFQLLRNGFVEVQETRRVPTPGAPPAAPASVVTPASEWTPPPQGPAPVAEPDAAGQAPAAAVAAAPASPVTTLEDDLAVAGNLMTRGEFDAALEILNATYRAHPGDEALRRLIEEAEVSFVDKAYRHYLPATKVPVLLRPPEEMGSERISPEEYFLLSRIDGTWDVKSIIQISPIREVDALRTLKRMREKGFIDLRDPS